MAGTRFPFKMGTGPFGAGGPPALEADLSITKSDTPDPVASGGSLVYSIGPSNAGPDNATNVEVVDTLPAGVTFVSAVGTGWVCGEVGGVVTCTRAGPEGIGSMPMITITVTAPIGPVVLNNSVTVTADEVDPNPGTATAVEATNVDGLPAAPTGTVSYSVGTAAGDIGNGGNLTIASGYITFDTPQPTNVGVGDEVKFSLDTIVYISGRISSTIYSVIDELGALPGNETSIALTSIGRAFADITTAITGSKDATHLNSSDLTGTGANVILQWPVYDDGAIDDGDFEVDFTSDGTHYLRAFAPFLTSDVGTSQRHTGVAGTGARLVYSVDQLNQNLRYFRIATSNLRLEGLEIDGSLVLNARGFIGVRVINQPSSSGDIRIDGCIIHDLISNASGSSSTCRFIEVFDSIDQIQVINCFCYRLEIAGTGGGFLHALRTDSGGGGTVAFVYNCTFFDLRSNGPSINGIQEGGGTITCRNTFVGKTTGSVGSLFSSLTVEDHNVSSNADASGTGSVINQTAFGTYFVNVTAGTEDLHLQNTSTVLFGSAGVDLSADVDAPVTDDIDTNARSAPYDFGGDQF